MSYQNNNFGYEIDFPEFSIEFLKSLRFFEISNILKNQIKQQYIYLVNLGEDLLENYDIDDTVLEEFILFVNDRYIPIPFYEVITESSARTQIYGRMLYQLLCVDFINRIIPKICEKNHFDSSEKLYSLVSNETNFRDMLVIIAKEICDIYNKILEVSPNNSEIKFDLLKYTFAMDLFDNDISMFISDFVLPAIKVYELNIDIKIGNTTPIPNLETFIKKG